MGTWVPSAGMISTTASAKCSYAMLVSRPDWEWNLVKSGGTYERAWERERERVCVVVSKNVGKRVRERERGRERVGHSSAGIHVAIRSRNIGREKDLCLYYTSLWLQLAAELPVTKSTPRKNQDNHGQLNRSQDSPASSHVQETSTHIRTCVKSNMCSGSGQVSSTVDIYSCDGNVLGKCCVVLRSQNAPEERDAIHSHPLVNNTMTWSACISMLIAR